jgi:hypothetical protein
MGRSFRQRKLKKVRRVKVQRISADGKKSKKKTMKQWEWWLIGAAIIFALSWVIFLGKSNTITNGPSTASPTAAATAKP